MDTRRRKFIRPSARRGRAHGGSAPAPFAASRSDPGNPRGLPARADSRFLLEKRLGLGGMCEVFMARDLARVAWGDASPHVAIKKLLPAVAHNRQARLSLAQEYATLRHLAHVNILRVFDLHMLDEDLYLSMEYLDGLSLYQALENRPHGFGGNGPSHARQLLDAVAYLHDHGIAHGDIKPENIFLHQEKRLVLLDFNMARHNPLPGAASAGQGLRERLRLPSYSLLYASPERMRLKAPSLADDVYSTCCSLYELLTGEHPYQRRSSTEAERDGLEPAKPHGLSRLAWKALRGGLSFDASRRPSIERLRQAFFPTGVRRFFPRLFT